MTNSIIITGGAGFIGYHLAKKLSEKNFKIYIIDNLSRGKFDDDFKLLLKKKYIFFIKKNLKEKISLRVNNLRYIFHLAGSVGVENVTKDPYHAFLNNISTLISILNFNMNLKKKAKLILFSTSEVYSPLIENNDVKFPINEKNEIILKNDITGRDSYYLSKIFNEKLTQLSKSDYLILRPHNIYGPRMGYSHVVPELIKKMYLEKNKKKKFTKVFSPKHKRAFCYIEDAINQIVQLSLNTKIKNTVFNIGNMNEETQIINLAKMIRKIYFSNSRLIKGQITEGSPTRRVPDMKKTNQKTKLIKYTKLEKGLIKTLEWYISDLQKK